MPLIHSTRLGPGHDTLSSGLDVDITNPLKGGRSILGQVGTTQYRVDTTSLAGGQYPMTLELQTTANCYWRQGPSDVLLDAINNRMKEDDWRIVNVDTEEEAYFAVVAEDGTATGVWFISRIDKII